MENYRINNQIKGQAVRLIGADGEHIGEKSLPEALQLAKEGGLDLVEMNPNANPPVCKIMDFGKFLYRQAKEKKKNDAHQKKNKLKTIRIGVTTGKHDLEMKAEKVLAFLSKGDKVRVELVLRGREKAHRDFAREKILEFLKIVNKEDFQNHQIKGTGSGFSVDIKADDKSK